MLKGAKRVDAGLKILVLTHRPLYPPIYGYSRVIIDTYSAIAEKNHQVCIISITPKKKGLSMDFNGVKYIILREPFNTFLKLGTTRVLLRLSKGELLFYHLLLLTREYASKKITHSIMKITKEYLGKPDIIVAETIYPGLLAEKLAKKIGAKYIVRIHNIEAFYISSMTRYFKKTAKNTISTLEERILNKANRVYALSYIDSITIQKLYNINAVYMPPIIIIEENEQKEILEKLGVKKNRYYLFIASPHKPNIFFLKKIIECWRNLRIQGYKLVIGGSISPIAERLLSRHNRDNIVVTGLLSREAISTLIKNAYAYIAPHHGSGVPIKLVEALQLGAPSITTANALQTIKGLKNKDNIYAINELNELCQAIKTLAKDENLYKKIKKGAKEFSKNLDYRKITDKFIKELLSIAH